MFFCLIDIPLCHSTNKIQSNFDLVQTYQKTQDHLPFTEHTKISIVLKTQLFQTHQLFLRKLSPHKEAFKNINTHSYKTQLSSTKKYNITVF